MQKELSNLKRHGQGIATANKVLVLATAPYDEQIGLILHILNQVKEARSKDLDVQQATKDLETVEAEYVNVESQTKQAIIDYWEEFGFETGKKSVVMDGCQLRIRETTNRQIVDPNKMVLAAREDGVYAKVIQELRPIVNRASFNSWVDLKSPLGVEVTHAVTASVTILEEDK